MFLSGAFYEELATLDDSAWQGVLDRHDFWHNDRAVEVETQADVATYLLLAHDLLASDRYGASFRGNEPDGVASISEDAFDDAALRSATASWAAMHHHNCGDGYTVAITLQVIKAGGVFGYRADGCLRQSIDLSEPAIHDEMIRVHASRRTLLPLRFNKTDNFLICGRRVPLTRGKLIEFSNVLPYAFMNQGTEDSVLLMTTYLVSESVPKIADKGEAETFHDTLSDSDGDDANNEAA